MKNLEIHSAEHLFDMDKDETEQPLVVMAKDVRELLDEVDTLLELVAINCPVNPQIRKHLLLVEGVVNDFLGKTTRKGELK